MFKEAAKQIAGKRPNTLISDGAPNFADAFKKEFFTRHIRHIHIQGDHNNAKMERMNAVEVRRPLKKSLRGSRRPILPVLAGYQIYHNYFRPREALKKQKPAEECGIMIDENKWKTMIQNAEVALRIQTNCLNTK